MTPVVFIRIDDVALHQCPQDQLVYELCHAGLHVTCAVVPAQLTRPCTEFLHFVNNCFPGTLEIHQHGYCHKNYADDASDKHEFGSQRTFEQQLNDIRTGRSILEDAFGALFFPAFTPPFGGYDMNTLLALKAAGFRVISGTEVNEQPSLLPDYIPSIDCFDWHPFRQKSWSEIQRTWIENQMADASIKSVCGFVLHPELMTFELVASFAANLPALLHMCQTVTFAQLLDS